MIYRSLISMYLILFSALFTLSYGGFFDKCGTEIVEHGAKFILPFADDIFRYFGLMGLLFFMKSVSWTKMLFGGFLAIVGVIYPIKNEKKTKEGEAKIAAPKINVFIKGSLRFVLVITGTILIIGSIIDGVEGKNDKTGIIGINLWVDKKYNPIIYGIIKNSPAEIAGLKINDKIIAVDNKSVKNKSLDDLNQLIRGKPNTYVKININRNDTLLIFDIQRIATFTKYQ